MTRSKRISERNDYIAERIRQTAYKAFYISTLSTGKLTGTIYTKLKTK